MVDVDSPAAGILTATRHELAWGQCHGHLPWMMPSSDGTALPQLGPVGAPVSPLSEAQDTADFES